MRIKRYRPAYFSGFDDEYAEADTLEQLRSIPWVESWTQGPDFHRLSLSENRLMAELKEGREWWVIAYLDGEGDFGLPLWHPVRS